MSTKIMMLSELQFSILNKLNIYLNAPFLSRHIKTISQWPICNTIVLLFTLHHKNLPNPLSKSHLGNDDDGNGDHDHLLMSKRIACSRVNSGEQMNICLDADDDMIFQQLKYHELPLKLDAHHMINRRLTTDMTTTAEIATQIIQKEVMLERCDLLICMNVLCYLRRRKCLG